MGHRELKTQVRRLLEQADFPAALEALRRLPGRQAVNPLFSFFFSGEELIRWRAVSAMGEVVATLADVSMESARVVMRRLMWSLNDESGGIGWGSPEAMGEITARHAGLADEFCRVLVSYIDPAGNFLEHEILQRGTLWGVGRLAHARPRLVRSAARLLAPFFEASDPCLRGTAVWAAGPVGDQHLQSLMARRLSDRGRLKLYRRQCITAVTVGELAREAISTGG